MIQNEKEKLTNICSDHLRVFEFDTEGAERMRMSDDDAMQTKRMQTLEIDRLSFSVVPIDRMTNT